MNLIKKSLLTFGATAALVGAFVAANPVEAEAAEWEPRTVEEVKADVESNGVESQYTIRWGDTLGTIARALDISVGQIAEVNEIANRDLIIAGNTLHLSEATDTMSVEDSQTHEVETYELEDTESEEPTETEDNAEAAEEPAAETTEASNEEAQAETENTASETPAPTSDAEAEAKEWIAFKESTDNYNARNGRHIGKYQLRAEYLDGDHSPENQERVAQEYVESRYGSWVAAKEFWLQNGWY